MIISHRNIVWGFAVVVETGHWYVHVHCTRSILIFMHVYMCMPFQSVEVWRAASINFMASLIGIFRCGSFTRNHFENVIVLLNGIVIGLCFIMQDVFGMETFSNRGGESGPY